MPEILVAGLADRLIGLKPRWPLRTTACSWPLLDPWWNPATEAQVVDRTHRIGRTRNVMVYRLIAKDTIEEKVLALVSRKAELFAGVMNDGNAFGTALDADDIRALLG